MTIGEFRHCVVCKEYWHFGGTFMNHACKPKWECRGDWEDDDDWTTIHAADSETAAEKYAEHYDCEGGEYAIVSGRRRHDTIILVRKPQDYDSDDTDEKPAVERWAIEAETVPTYRATKLDEAA